MTKDFSPQFGSWLHCLLRFLTELLKKKKKKRNKIYFSCRAVREFTQTKEKMSLLPSVHVQPYKTVKNKPFRKQTKQNKNKNKNKKQTKKSYHSVAFTCTFVLERSWYLLVKRLETKKKGISL